MPPRQAWEEKGQRLMSSKLIFSARKIFSPDSLAFRVILTYIREAEYKIALVFLFERSNCADEHVWTSEGKTALIFVFTRPKNSYVAATRSVVEWRIGDKKPNSSRSLKTEYIVRTPSHSKVL